MNIRISSYSDLNNTTQHVNIATPIISHRFEIHKFEEHYNTLISNDTLIAYTSILLNIIPYNHIKKIIGVYLGYSPDSAMFKYGNAGYIEISTSVSLVLIPESSINNKTIFSINLEEPGSLDRLKYEYRNYALIANKIEKSLDYVAELDRVRHNVRGKNG